MFARRVTFAAFVCFPIAACLDEVEAEIDPYEDEEEDGGLAVIEAPLDGCTGGAEGACDGTLSIPTPTGATGLVRYYRNHALGAPPSGIKRAIVVVHGNGRTPGQLRTIVEAARSEGKLGETIIVAPWFEEFATLPAGTSAGVPLCWDDQWKWGGDTRYGCGY
jgi:hypothetical protein